MLPRTTSGGYVPSEPETSKVPIARMGISHVLFLCLQGGGVLIGSGTVTFLSCTVTGNTAHNVRAHAQTSHRPDGENADALAPTHACTTANASVNYRMYVLQSRDLACKVPIKKGLTCLPRLSLAQLRPTLWSTTVGTCRRDFL